MTPRVSHRMTLSRGIPNAFRRLHAGYACRSRPIDDKGGRADVPTGELERIDQPGRGNDGGAVLIIVEHGNVHQVAQATLDHETVGRANILEVDSAKRLTQMPDAFDECFRVVSVDFKINGVDIGKPLEQDSLAFHDGF